MKFIIKIFLMGILSYLLPFYFAWWTIALGAGLISLLIRGSNFNSFNGGVIAGGLVWFYLSFTIDSATNSILSEKIALLINLTDSIWLIYASTLIGALVTGFGSLTGSLLGSILSPKKMSRNEYVS